MLSAQASTYSSSTRTSGRNFARQSQMKQAFFSVLFTLISINVCAQSSAEIAQLAKRSEGTIYVVPHRDSADGVLEACGLEFAALKADAFSAEGAPIKIVGSFYLRSHPTQGMAYMLKLGVFDGVGYSNGLAPANAFIRATNSNAPPKAIRQVSETKGYALFVGALNSQINAALAEIAEKKQVVIGFNRKPGQRDVTFTIDLTVVDASMGDDGKIIRKRSDEPVAQFWACTVDLANATEKSIR